MTDEQINQRIAEACGWTEIHNSGPWHNHKPWGYPPQPIGTGGNAYKYVPNYCTDLNAMHDAEKVILPKLGQVYANKLAFITLADYSDDPDFFCATARQRAEAFLKTLGKWEEVQG